MNSKTHNLLSILFLLTISINAQSMKKVISDAAYAEKIYVQVTSTVLTTEDELWFKCLVTDVNQTPTQLSNILHVELIDFDERIIENKLFKIEEGVVCGFIDLNEKMNSGRYQLRAYTEWNKNFGDDFISKVYVDIYQSKEIKEQNQAIREITLKEISEGKFELSAKAYPRLMNSKYRGKLQLYVHTEHKTDTIEVKRGENYEYSFQYALPKDAIKARLEMHLDSIKLRNNNKGYISSYSKTVVVNKEYLDVQFFPEGGKMIAGLQNKVAFKALDCQNKGIQIEGKIANDSDEAITPFSSNELGMGVFHLKPKKGESYHAEIKGKDGVVHKYPLPKAESKGVVVYIEESGNKIILKANSNLETQKNVLVKIQSHGMSQRVFFMEFENKQAIKELEKSKFSEGILKFSVYNLKGQIVNERLFFNYKEEDRISIEASLDKQNYQQREKTRVKIVAKDRQGNPIASNLSVLVINKELLGESYESQNTIISYFLLNSEVKGQIENPSCYFDKENPERKEDLDALLLTQGWRKYTYDIPLTTGKFSYLPEKNLTVSGSIKNIWTKEAPKSPLELTLMYEPLRVQTQHSKAKGKFKFNLRDEFKERFKVAIQSKDKKGKKKEIKVELDSYQIPEVIYEKEEKVYLTDSIYKEVIAQNIKIKEAEEAYSLVEGAELLDEVELTGYVMTPQRQKVMDLHGVPDVVIENEELLKNAPFWEHGLSSVIEASFPDVANHLSYVRNRMYNSIDDETRKQIRKYDNLTFYLVDGILLERDVISGTLVPPDLPMEEIKSIELLKKPKNSRYYMNYVLESIDTNGDLEEIKSLKRMTALNANITILSIYTYAGKGMNFVRKNYGMKRLFTQGFTAQSTEFYSPKYDNETPNNLDIPDLRSVVHWSPVVKTNEEGEAELEFYNGDNMGEMLLIVEGITQKGKIVDTEMSYTVVEK